MKIRYLVLVLSLMTFSMWAQTNTPAPSLETVKATAQTNLNQVLIEMLSGVKEAGSEIYAASKEALHTGVNFVSEQAPDVLKQFLTWQFYRAMMNAIGWCSLSATLIGFSVWFHRRRKGVCGDTSGYTFGKWCSRCLGIFVLFTCMLPNIFTMVQIKVAPKVYVIQYVVDTVQAAQAERHRQDYYNHR